MADLSFVNIKENSKDIKRLYKSAFPANERMPFWLLKRLAKKENADFYGIYDKEKFVGIIYNIYHKDIVFIFYFAINENLIGKLISKYVYRK